MLVLKSHVVKKYEHSLALRLDLKAHKDNSASDRHPLADVLAAYPRGLSERRPPKCPLLWTPPAPSLWPASPPEFPLSGPVYSQEPRAEMGSPGHCVSDPTRAQDWP